MSEMPDVLGENGRAEAVAAAIRVLQAELFQLSLRQSLSNAPDEAPVPGLAGPDGAVVSFEDARADVNGRLGRIEKAYPAEVEKVKEAVQ